MSESGCRDLFSICSSGRLHQAEQPPKLGFHTGSVSSTQDKGLVVLWRINPLRWIKLLMLDWPFRVTHRHFKNFATNFNSEVFWPENHQINGADKVTADWRTGRRSDSLGQSTSPAGLQRAAPLWPGASHTLHLEEPGRTWKNLEDVFWVLPEHFRYTSAKTPNHLTQFGWWFLFSCGAENSLTKVQTLVLLNQDIWDWLQTSSLRPSLHHKKLRAAQFSESWQWRQLEKRRLQGSQQ